MSKNDFSGKHLNSLLTDYDSHSKEEYYDALLTMTEYYLNELLSSASIQAGLANVIGKDRADELIEKISGKEGEKVAENVDLFGSDKLARIKGLYDYIAAEYGDQMATPEELSSLDDIGNLGGLEDF